MRLSVARHRQHRRLLLPLLRVLSPIRPTQAGASGVGCDARGILQKGAHNKKGTDAEDLRRITEGSLTNNYMFGRGQQTAPAGYAPLAGGDLDDLGRAATLLAPPNVSHLLDARSAGVRTLAHRPLRTECVVFHFFLNGKRVFSHTVKDKASVRVRWLLPLRPGSIRQPDFSADSTPAGAESTAPYTNAGTMYSYGHTHHHDGHHLIASCPK